ncbi:energy-coupling factor transporter transmembrane protein EcfT [bacterium]|nr:MAG: energy-coupling factor transporter transmembrane protein EcfT [bacterium]
MVTLALLMGVTFAVSAPGAIVLHTVFILTAIRLSKIPLVYFLRSLRFFIWLFLFTAILHLFFTQGEPIFVQAPLDFLPITYEGLERGGLISWRLLVIIALSALLTHTTTPLEITRGMESILSPLERLRFPVQDFSLMMMMSIRFIPVLSEETQRVWKAQRSRGADFGRGGLKKKAHTLMSVLLPVFAGVFRRADELATALEARGYVPGQRRTSMKQLFWTGRETSALVILTLWMATLAGLQVIG